MLTLILVRHAATVANEAGLYIGRSESPLSLQGKEDARKLCEKLEKYQIQQIYASPARRVQETIKQLINKNIPVQMVEALHEIDFGICETKDFNWLKTNYPEEVTHMIKEGIAYRYPKGESLVMAHQRVADWLNDFFKYHQSGTFLVAAHGGTIRCILSELLVKNPALHWHFKIAPATITVVSMNEGFPVIESLNERC